MIRLLEYEYRGLTPRMIALLRTMEYEGGEVSVSKLEIWACFEDGYVEGGDITRLGCIARAAAEN